VLDNLNTHSGPHVEAWLAGHPGRLAINYLPYHASWLNQIELWFNTLQRRCLRLADFASGHDMAAKILAFIDTYNRLHGEHQRPDLRQFLLVLPPGHPTLGRRPGVGTTTLPTEGCLYQTSVTT